MKKKHIGKKYKIEKEYLDGRVVDDPIRIVFLKKIPGTPIVHGSVSRMSNRRNLSQLGTCYFYPYLYPSVPEGLMLFGDSDEYYFGKSINIEEARTYKGLQFSNKLFRFVRS